MHAGSEPWNGSAWFLHILYLFACILRTLCSLLHKIGRRLHDMHVCYLARFHNNLRDFRMEGNVLGQDAASLVRSFCRQCSAGNVECLDCVLCAECMHAQLL
jgi:hypothetical protein